MPRKAKIQPKRKPRVKRHTGGRILLDKAAKVIFGAAKDNMDRHVDEMFGNRTIEHELTPVDEAPSPKYEPMPTDPWAHRSIQMRCSTCMWSVRKGELGRCRRHAPTMSGYPVIFPTDWCGDHKLDETKV